MKIQVVACDVDQQVPAKTYTIEVSDGRKISKDLCEEHAGYLEDLLEELEVSGDESEPEPEPEAAPTVPVRRAAAKKAPAKKTAEKTAVPARRRAKITSFAEIEASKNQ
ncbi:hypothetical protein [Streptomyces sp. NPDC046805]|uniref:hypothetical protein n=1 Tax=Streptomyces sp. NPDC046805 TaxID=3155134 RepID=UPI00340ECA30